MWYSQRQVPTRSALGTHRWSPSAGRLKQLHMKSGAGTGIETSMYPGLTGAFGWASCTVSCFGVSAQCPNQQMTPGEPMKTMPPFFMDENNAHLRIREDCCKN